MQNSVVPFSLALVVAGERYWGPSIELARFERTAYTREGDAIPVEVSARLAAIDGEVYVVTSARNIIERRRYESALNAPIRASTMLVFLYI